MDATLAGLIGTIIGAVATFAGSWYGAEKGAIKNAILQSKQIEYIAARGLLNNLTMTVNVYKGLIDTSAPKDSTMFRKIIFDPDWAKQICQVKCITETDNLRLLEWFSYIATIETNFAERTTKLTEYDLKTAFTNDTSEIEKIIEIISEWIKIYKD